MASDKSVSTLREIMLALPSCSGIVGAPVKIMVDGLSPHACVSARVIRRAGRWIMIDFARGWAELRMRQDGFMVRVGFQGGMTDIGAGWEAVAYAESDGSAIIRAANSPSSVRGLVKTQGNVLHANFQGRMKA